MGKLDADCRALPPHESDQRLVALDLSVAPDTEIMFVDEPDFLHAGRLDEDETEAAERIAAEMHQMKGAASVAGLSAVMDHWRHDEAVLQLKATNGERFEKHRPCSPATIGWSITHWRFSFATETGCRM